MMGGVDKVIAASKINQPRSYTWSGPLPGQEKWGPPQYLLVMIKGTAPVRGT